MSSRQKEPPPEPLESRFRHAEGPKRSERAHGAVLKAAQAVLVEGGYQKATIERIAKAAGVGKQTIYRWWPSKAALYMEVYVSLAEEHVRPPDTGGVADDLRRLWRQLARFYRKTPAGAALAGLLAEAQGDEHVATTFRGEFLTTRRQVTLDLLQKGVERGEVRMDADLEGAVDLLAGAVWYRLLVDGAPPSERRLDALVDQLLRGIRKP